MLEIYTVKEGDTLNSIANKFGINIEEIYKANNFLPLTEIKSGDKIIIPMVRKPAFYYYEIKEGDTLYNIANKYKTNPNDLALINGLNIEDYIYKDQVILVPKEGYIFTISKRGDNLEDIARRLNAPIEEILLQNPNVYLLEDQLITYNTLPGE